jgi:predicted MFS family arabinose efflux permease
MVSNAALVREPKTFEWWMLSNFAVGAGYSAFVSLLIPPFVKEVTGDAAAAGVVMAIIALGALLGPTLGSFADRYSAHRAVLVAGVGGMALAFVMLALASERAELYALDAIVMGVGVAAVSAVGPVFIVGARLDQEVEARQLTTFSLMMPAGQLAGGLLLAAVTSWSFSQRFWLAASVMGLALAFVWFTSALPSRRLQAAIASREPEDAHAAREARKVSLKQVFLSLFGVYILVLTLSSIANNGVNSQIANIMPEVYGMDEQTTSAMIGLAGLLNIVLFFPAGKWMGRSGAFSPFAAGIVARFVAGIGMAAVGVALDNAVLLGAAFMQLMYNAAPFVRLAQPSLAVRYATFPAGAASGWVIAASATGSFLGSVIGGFLADQFGFNAVNWMAAVGAGLSVVVLWFGLRPGELRIRNQSRAGVPDAPSNTPIPNG